VMIVTQYDFLGRGTLSIAQKKIEIGNRSEMTLPDMRVLSTIAK